jgi:hypothetical protein
MSDSYISDREQGPRARTLEDIDQTVWSALRYLIRSRIEDGSFGYKFPEVCADGAGPCGCDWQKFNTIARAEVPDLPNDWLDSGPQPAAVAILDVLQFCARNVAKPIQGGYHSYFQHYHLGFDRIPGLAEFVADVNRLLARNCIAFELTPEGQAIRLGPPLLREVLVNALFRTGEAETDRLMEEARTRLRAFLETEAKELTAIGNSMRIRHSEATQEKVEKSEEVDYLFHRAFSFIRLILRATGREA